MSRKLHVVLSLVLCLLSISTYATVYRVNNTGADADFTAPQAAHDAASAGDTLYIEASPNSYGDLTISKEIHIFGPGYFLSQNLELQANPNPASIYRLYINGTASESTIQGMTFDYVANTTANPISNLIFRRNRVTQGIYFSNVPLSNVFILNNFIEGSHGTYQGIRTGGSGTKSLTILNNIFKYVNTSSRLNLGSNTTAIIKNNVLELYYVTSSGCTYINNIFVYDGGGPDMGSNTFINNVAVGTQVPTGNNNMQNVSMSTVFEGYPTQGSFSNDRRFELKSGSPAIGAGQGGVDCGAFDGDAPYLPSGIPAIPSIYSLTAPSVVTGNFNVQLSTRSNN